MKKIFLAVIIFYCSAITGNAQGFRFGAKAGANLGQISGQSFNSGFNLGYHLGGFIELDLSKTLGIQPEVFFSQTNTHLANNSSQVLNVSTGDSISLNYLSIPVLLRISAGKALTIVVGPQYSILLNNNSTLLQNGQDAFKNGDFSMIAGLQFNLGIVRIYGRYVAGMSDISQVQSSDSWKNQQLQLGVGLKLISIQKKSKEK